MEQEEILIGGFLTEEQIKSLSLRQGYLMEDKDYLFLSNKSYPISELISIDLSLEIVSIKTIVTADSKINYFEGVKRFKIKYKDDTDQEIDLIKKAAFNGSFMTALKESSKNIQVHLLHGYFYIADDHTIDYYISYFLKHGIKPSASNIKYNSDSEYY